MSWAAQHLTRLDEALGEVAPLDLSFELPLNDPETCSYKAPRKHHLATIGFTEPTKTHFQLRRDGVPVIGGFHTSVNASSDDIDEISISGSGWMEYWNRRRYPFNPPFPFQYVRGTYAAGDLAGLPHIEIFWTTTDIFTIVREMVNEAQLLNNSIVINLGSDLSGFTQHFDFPLADMSSLKSHIDRLADQQPGFDYEITPAKNLLMYAPRKTSATPVFGANLGPGGNVASWTYEYSGIRGTRMIGQGNPLGSGSDDMSVLRQNLFVEDQYHNYSVSEHFGNVRNRDRLAARTQRALNLAVRKQYDLSLTFAGVEVCDEIFNNVETGFTVHVEGDVGYEVLDTDMRVEIIRGEVDRDGNERITLELAMPEV